MPFEDAFDDLIRTIAERHQELIEREEDPAHHAKLDTIAILEDSLSEAKKELDCPLTHPEDLPEIEARIEELEAHLGDWRNDFNDRRFFNFMYLVGDFLMIPVARRQATMVEMLPDPQDPPLPTDLVALGWVQPEVHRTAFQRLEIAGGLMNPMEGMGQEEFLADLEATLEGQGRIARAFEEQAELLAQLGLGP